MQVEAKKRTLFTWAVKRESKEEVEDVKKVMQLSEMTLPLGNSMGNNTIIAPCNEVPIELPLISNKENKNMVDNGVVGNESVDVRLPFLINPLDMNMRDQENLKYDKTSLYIPEECFRKMTNCEEQFWRIKQRYYDNVVFFKKGKFYELFEEDAVISSEIFGWKLTKRGSVKMTGIPEMSLDVWVERFILKGYKVAVVEQKETGVSQNMRIKEEEGKASIIQRELKEVITEVTHSQEGLGLCCVIRGKENGLCLLYVCVFRTISSEFFVVKIEEENIFQLNSLLRKENIKEIISNELLPFKEKITKIREDRWGNSSNGKFEQLEIGHLSEKEKEPLKILVSYLEYLKYNYSPRFIEYKESSQKYLYLDGRTIETLQLTDTKNSFFNQIDRTKTHLGKRLLRKWILHPLYSLEEIDKRFATVEALEECKSIFDLKEGLKKVQDIPVYVKKARNQAIKPQEIKRIIDSLKSIEYIIPFLTQLLEKKESKNTFLPAIVDSLSKYAIYKDIVKGFRVENEQISLLPTDERLIKGTKNKEEVVRRIEEYAEQVSKKEEAIFSAKRIGREYFLETKEKIKIFSKTYIPSGSTKTIKKYTTQQLKKLSEELLEAEERLILIAQDSILEISKRIVENEDVLHEVSHAIAQLDCFICFTEVQGCKGTFSSSLVAENITNVQGTHTPNTIEVTRENPLTVITGPNMGGKSTFLRNISICVIARQIGMRIPASSFSAPLYDRVFTRIGAGDNLIEGESTFYLEMKETSCILHEATENSFVIIDELGRGTSAREGTAISYAVKEYLKKIACIVFYSTHFFKAITETDNVFRMAYENDPETGIRYLHKIQKGICRDSCGIEICQLVKAPASVVQRAICIKKERVV
ncbi:DNA mismatch repair protein MSH6 [Nematocida sp. LUAm3]|nr:DNA mismatch repair protein MSH6 [Nematocida sp. LUAm3]KAI5174899.1 DNA mismatch repair protein MSH6 [Nematocida sp. LUAm2]KAI5177503.1 DNA mismatch repair protein MSH6 [Nematocida sp. LUAm1]